MHQILTAGTNQTDSEEQLDAKLAQLGIGCGALNGSEEHRAQVLVGQVIFEALDVSIEVYTWLQWCCN